MAAIIYRQRNEHDGVLHEPGDNVAGVEPGLLELLIARGIAHPEPADDYQPLTEGEHYDRDHE